MTKKIRVTEIEYEHVIKFELHKNIDFKSKTKKI